MSLCYRRFDLRDPRMALESSSSNGVRELSAMPDVLYCGDMYGVTLRPDAIDGSAEKH